MSDTKATPPAGDGTEGTQEQQQEQVQTFTQEDVDRIVKERVQRERTKYADYDDLKVKAGEKATVEDRLAEMEKRAAGAEARALRADIASRYEISPEDRDLFLTGSDEESLTAQAQRLAARESDRKKQGNHVPNEGNNPKSGDDPMREFTRGLFQAAAADQ